MPAHLLQAVPMLVLGLAALAWIVLRWARLRQGVGEPGLADRRDLAVGLAPAASWLAVWGLYSAYYWTANAVGTTLQFTRFYVPALGAISLLGAWLVTRIPGRAWRAGLTTTVVIGYVGLVKRLLGPTSKCDDIDIFEVNEAFTAQALAVS